MAGPATQVLVYERRCGDATKPLVKGTYQRHEPQRTVLYQLVEKHLNTLLRDAQLRSEHGYGYPHFIEKTFRNYVDCGPIELGFCRVVCPSCGYERLRAFSCKCRGVCPSCDARRMSDTAAHLVDRVLPTAPYRQFVLTFPIPIRLLLLRDAKLVSFALRTFTRRVFAWQRRSARTMGIEDPQCGAVTFAQRWGSSFERVGHEVGRRCVANRVDIEEVLAAELQVPDGAASVSASVDRVAVPMEEPRPRPIGRPKKGAPKRPIEVVYRMAYCATLTIHDDNGEALHTIRYGRMPNGDADELVEAVASDALALVRKSPTLRVVSLGDGAPEVWNLLERHVDDESFGTVTRLVDFWHLIEKLAPAAKVIAGAGTHHLLARWRTQLANRVGAARAILTELRDSNREGVTVGHSRPVHEAITYIENHHHRMNYAHARKLGLPIGSGNVEATCKSLFGLRIKRPGARWRDQSGEEIVTLRAHQLSDRWKRAMELTIKPTDVEIRRAA